jgi:bile acid:Na+ symporter, BASS family
MTLELLIPLAIDVSMFLIVFSLGLRTTLNDATSLVRQPGLLLRSILSMNVIMPILAVLVAALFDLHPAIKIALVALALSPVPPALPDEQEQAGGSASYTIGLLIAASIVAIGLVPAGLELVGHIFRVEAFVPPEKIASIVLVSVVVPLMAGIALRTIARDLSRRIAKPISIFATILLIVILLPGAISAWPAIWALVGNGVVVILIGFNVGGIAVGHFLGGPKPDDRTVLALATGSRHPGVAMAIATFNFPDENNVLAVVIFYGIIGVIVSFPYFIWRRRTHAANQAKAGS